MMMPMAKFVAGTKAFARGSHVAFDIHNSTVAKADDLRLATFERSVEYLDVLAPGDGVNFDITRIRDTQIYEKFFRRAHKSRFLNL
jgi:hypothetical protein